MYNDFTGSESGFHPCRTETWVLQTGVRILRHLSLLEAPTPYTHLPYLLHFLHPVLFSCPTTYHFSLVMKSQSVALLTLSLYAVCNAQSLTLPRESQTPGLIAFHQLTSPHSRSLHWMLGRCNIYHGSLQESCSAWRARC